MARDTLEQLTDLVLVPLSGLGGSGVIQQNPSEAEIFYNSTGFLRYLLWTSLSPTADKCLEGRKHRLYCQSREQGCESLFLRSPFLAVLVHQGKVLSTPWDKH